MSRSLVVLFSAALAALLGCSSDSLPECLSFGPSTTVLGPTGGFVSSLAFAPDQIGIVWASGDDSSGLFRSTDAGVSWSKANTPPDHSTYSLVFDPSDGSRIYAPNRFGRGLLTSGDGGQTWTVEGEGLPVPPASVQVDDFLVDPQNSARLFACTGSGLFVSTDFGETFAELGSASFGGETHFTAAAASAAGLFVGGQGGGVFRSVNGGADWTEVATGAQVGDLALTSNALYIARNDGSLQRTVDFGPAGLVVLDPPGGGAFETGLWLRLGVASGSSVASDIVYVGSVITPLPGDWGFFTSMNGGASFEQREAGLGDNSIFSLAVDPFDPMHVLVGTLGDGIYASPDAGLTWTRQTAGIEAAAVLAAVEDASDPSHLLVSSTEGLNGTPGVWETFDEGEAWSQVASVPVDALALEMDPGNASHLLVGGFNGDGHDNPAIHRSVSGSGGPWEVVLDTRVRIERFVRGPGRVYAVATDFSPPATLADLGLYASGDGGASWTQVFAQLVTNLSPNPASADEVVVVGEDAWVTTDGFQSPPVSLGLMAAAPGRIFTSVARDSATGLLVGTNTGELFRTANFDPAAGVIWEQIEIPVQSVFLRDIHVEDGGWYVGCWTGDLLVQPDSTPGLYRSLNGGVSWEVIPMESGGSRLLWSLQRRAGGDVRFLGARWGGGLVTIEGSLGCD